MSDPQTPAERPYKDVLAGFRDGAYTVLLDGRQLRTPARNQFKLPTKALAELCAEEWAAQGPAVRPETMPATRLANVAIDQTPVMRARMIDDIAGYAATDLLCHRAAEPAALVKRQSEAWDPLLAWATETLGVSLKVVCGVIAADQPLEARVAYERAASELSDFKLTALAHGVALSGSGVIALALARGRLSAEGAYRTAMVDDLWQLETWGEDFVARERLNLLEGEFQMLARFFVALEPA